MLKEFLYDFKKLLYNKSMFVAFILLLVIGFSFGYYFTGVLNNKAEDSPIDIQNQDLQLVDDEQREIQVSTEKQDAKIESTTKIVYEIQYLKSNDVDKEITMPQESILGFNESEIQSHFNDWTIQSFDDKELVLHKAIDSYSPGHYKIGVATEEDQGFIAVFNFNKEGQEVLEFISDTPISLLNKGEQNKLNSGMIFDNIEEVYRMLENYDL